MKQIPQTLFHNIYSRQVDFFAILNSSYALALKLENQNHHFSCRLFKLKQKSSHYMEFLYKSVLGQTFGLVLEPETVKSTNSTEANYKEAIQIPNS